MGFYPHEFWRELEAFRRGRGRGPEPRGNVAGVSPREARGEEPEAPVLEAALCALL